MGIASYKVIGIIVAVCVTLLVLVWPTPWKYQPVNGTQNEPGEWDRRTNRMSGESEVYIDWAWRSEIFNRANMHSLEGDESEPAP